MPYTWVCGKCGYFTTTKTMLRNHFKRLVPCDSNKIFVVDEIILQGLDEDKTNFNIFTLPIMKV